MIQKLFSARFWTILMVTFTYCWIVMATARAYLDRATPDKLEGFAMGIVMGFSSFAVKTLIEYFNRDRTPTNGGTK